MDTTQPSILFFSLLYSISLTVAMNTHNEVCAIVSLGGVPVQPSDMLEMMQVVKDKTQTLAAAFEAAFEKDERARNGEGKKKRGSVVDGGAR